MAGLDNLVVGRESILLVIDAQNDVCDSEGDLRKSKRGIDGIQRTFQEGIIPMVKKARRANLPIGYIRSIYTPGQFPNVSQEWLTPNPEWRIGIYRDLLIEGEHVFEKDDHNPFFYKGKQNGLANWLQDRRRIFISGFTTDHCITVGTYAFKEKGYEPIVLEDCVSTPDHKLKDGRHEQALNRFREDSILVTNSYFVNIAMAGSDYIGAAVGAMIFNNSGEVFLSRRSLQCRNEKHTWEFPGGEVRFGETLQDAIIREMREEYGVEVKPVELLDAVDHILPAEGQHWISPVYICKLIGGEPKIMESSKCDKVGWFSLDKLPQPLSNLSEINRRDYIARYDSEPFKFPSP